jgi:hypothetical protein
MDLLESRGEIIRAEWFRAALAPFPESATRFFSSEEDEFRNPVGRTLAGCNRVLLDWLFSKAGDDTMRAALREIARILSIQEFPPSKVLAFIFAIKDIVKREVESVSEPSDFSGEVALFETRTDRLALFAFDEYLECREKIYEIRTNEVKARTFKLLERAQRLQEAQGGSGDADAFRAEP